MRLKWLCRFCLFGLLCLYTVYYWRLGGLEDRSAPLVRIGRENQARSRINPDDVFDPKKCLLRCVSGRQATACERVDVKIVGTKTKTDVEEEKITIDGKVYVPWHAPREDSMDAVDEAVRKKQKEGRRMCVSVCRRICLLITHFEGRRAQSGDGAVMETVSESVASAWIKEFEQGEWLPNIKGTTTAEPPRVVFDERSWGAGMKKEPQPSIKGTKKKINITRINILRGGDREVEDPKEKTTSKKTRRQDDDDENDAMDGDADTRLLSSDELSLFRERLDEEKSMFRSLLRALATIYKDSEIDYMIVSGTVLGYCRHAGSFIPYDDDVDLLMAEKDWERWFSAIDKWNRGTEATSSKLGRLLYISDKDGAGGGRPGKVFKLFWENTPRAGWTKWNYPYVDVFSYVINYQTGETESPDPAGPLPAKTPGDLRWPGAQVAAAVTGRPLVWPHEYLFPTQIVDFEGIKIRAPRELSAFLDWEYGKDWRTKCQVGDWDHKTEEEKDNIPPGASRAVECQRLAEVHPEWKISTEEDSQRRCPSLYVPSQSAINVLTRKENDKPHVCGPGSDGIRLKWDHLFRRFSMFAKEANLEYWFTSGTALGQELWDGAIPWDLDLDVSVAHRDGERLLEWSKEHSHTLKTKFNAKLVVQPDYKIPNWADRKYYPNQEIRWKAPIARFMSLDNLNDHVDIVGEPDHNDWPEMVPPGKIAVLTEDYMYLMRPKEWVYPLRKCYFDGILASCQREQALYLRTNYGADFRAPHKICHENKWFVTSRCVPDKCGELPPIDGKDGKDWCWIDRGPVKDHHNPTTEKKWKYCSLEVEKKLAEIRELA